jgi:MFS family permease
MMHAPRREGDQASAEKRTFRQRLVGALGSLRYRDFRILWFGTLGNSGIMWMDIVVRNWLAWELTESYVAIATVNIARMLPSMFLAVPAGVLVDRVDRRKVLIAAQSGIFALYGVLAVLALTDILAMWNMYILFGLMGATSALTQPARQSIIPMVVPREAITNAVAIQQAGFNSTRIFGMAGAGFMMEAFGAGVMFVLLAGTAAFVILTSVMLRLPEMASPPPVSPFRSAAQGLGYIGRTTVLRVLLIITFLVMLLGLPFSSLLPGLVDDVFNAGPRTFGTLMSVTGVGSLIATLLIASIRFRRPGMVVLTGTLLFATTLMAFVFLPDLAARSGLITAAVLLGIGGFASGIHMATSNALMLTQSDPAYHGRVMSMNMLNHGFMPLGAYPAAWIAGSIGAASAIALMGVVLFVAAILVALTHPSLLRIRADASTAVPAMGHGGGAGPVRAPAGGSGESEHTDHSQQGRT